MVREKRAGAKNLCTTFFVVIIINGVMHFFYTTWYLAQVIMKSIFGFFMAILRTLKQLFIELNLK